MITIKSKYFLSLLYLFFFNYSATFAEIKICEIKYNEKGGELALEARMNIKRKNRNLSDKFLFDCYIIGLEHDNERRPIANKPIYACCRNI